MTNDDSVIAGNRLAILQAHLTPGDKADTAAVAMGHTSASSAATWKDVSMAPPDPILGLNEAFKADPATKKLNLGVGAYRTEDGRPLVLNVVRKAEMRIVTNPASDKEYLPITGIPAFCKLAQKLAFGDIPAVQDGRIVTCQSISGTGAVRLGAEFLARFCPKKVIYVCVPTWGNHLQIFPAAGLTVKTYRYYDAASKGLDYGGMLADLERAEAGSIVLLHACAHNPTGVDPTPAQWDGILRLVQQRNLLCFFDSAYQGFASGCLDRDAYSLRTFAAAGVPVVLSQSFAKNMGLYGERAGAFSVVCSSAEEARRVESQVKGIVRAMYSNPPKHGGAIVAEVLSSPELFAEWRLELKGMADRINDMRKVLVGALQARQVPGDWSHITKQIGMFSFTGLTKAQVGNLTSKWHIYLTADGRISMAGLNAQTCDYLAEAIKDSVLSC